ncbi:metallophosphoesterase [Methanohalobium sp.]|uniref:metallophosphoesterase n=1 Tax=Methanohalobium sp. TaxID=2837493 RepID=UPI0025D9588F|nr:metallophosphoesterase [Methanohalobium sp.]
MIGIMSDSHDNMDAIYKAVSVFNEKNVNSVLHAGDIVSPFTGKALRNLESELYYVFGNNDGDILTIKKWFDEIGAENCGNFGDLTIEGRHIALVHGVNNSMVKAIAGSGDYDVVVRGHTHNRGTEYIKGTLIINPGETAGVLTGNRSIALLDTDTLDVEFVEI